MMARPTTTSAAATTIEKNARTWPFRLPICRENATSERFTAFSWSSTDMKITSALRRSRTPTVPIVNRTPDRIRKYEIGVLTSRHHLWLRRALGPGLDRGLGSGRLVGGLSGHDHGGDGGHDQQHRRHLEREEERVEQELRERVDVPALVRDMVDVRRGLRAGPTG